MSSSIEVGDFKIGNNRTFVIAEIGSNHNQDLELAFEHIRAAKKAGADAVKFQSINVDKLYYEPTNEIIELHQKIDLKEEWHYKLNEFCKTEEIIFFTSPTYIKAIDILEEIDIPIYKLASAQIGTFPQLVRRVASLNKPTILSTGIVNYSQLNNVIKIFEEENNSKYIILHCNSIYPTPSDAVNLKLMQTYKEMFGSVVGFSDHTLDIFAPIAAVARGAKVIEKHFTLDKELPTPDAKFALEPAQFKRMTEGIRKTEKVWGDSSRVLIRESEKNFKENILTKLILKNKKNKGDDFTPEDFYFRRNIYGINCGNMNFIISNNFMAKKVLKKDVPLTWNDIE